MLVSIMAAVLPTTFTYVDDAGATVEATKSWVLNWDKVASASLVCSAEDHACQMGI